MTFSLDQDDVATEPVSIAEAKAHLAVDHNDDDVNIGLLVTAARKRFELQTNRMLAARTCTLRIDDFPRRECEYTDLTAAIRLPVWPVATVEAVKYYDANGTLTTISTSEWLTFLQRKPSLVYPAPGKVWPSVQYGRLARVVVEFTAGVDPELEQGKAAVLLMLAYWYGRRGDSDDPTGTDPMTRGVPAGALAIMNGLMRPVYT